MYSIVCYGNGWLYLGPSICTVFMSMYKGECASGYGMSVCVYVYMHVWYVAVWYICMYEHYGKVGLAPTLLGTGYVLVHHLHAISAKTKGRNIGFSQRDESTHLSTSLL